MRKYKVFSVTFGSHTEHGEKYDGGCPFIVSTTFASI